MLVTRDEIEQPLIGFNVIEQLTKEYENIANFSNTIGKSFPDLPENKLNHFVTCLACRQEEMLGTVKNQRKL